MRIRPYTLVTIALAGITLFFLLLTVLFSAGIPVDFRGGAVTAVLTFGGILNAVSLFASKVNGNPTKKIGFFLTHAGIVVLLLGFALFEVGGDTVTASVPIGGESYYANIQRESGEVCELGFNFRVDDFAVETYEDGSDKQYRATLSFADAVTLRVETEEISVNHTVRRGDWKIYLMNYGSGYVHLLFRRDPGEAVVKTGAVLMILGTLTELLAANVRPRKKEARP